MEPMDVLEKLVLNATKPALGIIGNCPWSLLAVDSKSGQAMQKPIRTAVPATMTTRAADAKLLGS